ISKDVSAISIDLHEAILAQDIPLVESLLQNDIDLNEQCTHPDHEEYAYDMPYPLFDAIATNNHAIAELLIKQGANVNLRNTVSGYSLFMYAAAFYAADLDMLKLLVANGAQPTGQDIATALSKALEYRSDEPAQGEKHRIAQYLLTITVKN